MRSILVVALGLVLAGCATRLPTAGPSPARTAVDDAVATAAPPRDLAARFVRCETEGMVREPEAEEERFRRQRITLFLGYTAERSAEGGQTVAVDYLYRFDRHWGVGAFVDLAAGGLKSRVLGAGLDIHPIEPVFLFVGAGIEWVDGESQGLLRVGGGYEWEVGERTTLGPAVYVDVLEEGKAVYVAGLMLGYAF